MLASNTSKVNYMIDYIPDGENKEGSITVYGPISLSRVDMFDDSPAEQCPEYINSEWLVKVMAYADRMLREYSDSPVGVWYSFRYNDGKGVNPSTFEITVKWREK